MYTVCVILRTKYPKILFKKSEEALKSLHVCVRVRTRGMSTIYTIVYGYISVCVCVCMNVQIQVNTMSPRCQSLYPGSSVLLIFLTCRGVSVFLDGPQNERRKMEREMEKEG